MKKLFLTFCAISILLSGCGAKTQPETQVETSSSSYVEDMMITLNLESEKCTGLYTGHLVNLVPDGVGEFTLINNNEAEWVYIGEWKEGHFNGYGTKLYANGLMETASYENDYRNGSEIVLLENNSIYNGHAKDNEASGNGILYNNQGCYTGNFSNGQFSGDGIFYFFYGQRYEGTFKKGEIDGEGTLIYSNGDKIVGTFKFNDDKSAVSGTGDFYPADEYGNHKECEVVNGEIVLEERELSENAVPEDETTENTAQASTEKDTQSSTDKEFPQENTKQNATDEQTAQAKQTNEQSTPTDEQPASVLDQSSSNSTNTNPSGNADAFNTYNNESQQQTTASYVLNTSTHKFHYPNCRSVPKIAPQNYATANSRDEIIAQGYSPCGNCNP